MKDLDSRENIIEMVNGFYDLVKVDPDIGKFFTEKMAVDWEKHLPKMYDFWSSIILGDASYQGNPIASHKHVHDLMPFTTHDFTVWLKLFEKNLDNRYKGPFTEIARQRAHSIATVLQLKLIHKH